MWTSYRGDRYGSVCRDWMEWYSDVVLYGKRWGKIIMEIMRSWSIGNYKSVSALAPVKHILYYARRMNVKIYSRSLDSWVSNAARTLHTFSECGMDWEVMCSVHNMLIEVHSRWIFSVGADRLEFISCFQQQQNFFEMDDRLCVGYNVRFTIVGCFRT